jgi:hypothetical protein
MSLYISIGETGPNTRFVLTVRLLSEIASSMLHSMSWKHTPYK